jgi:hypothetical protein
MPRVEGQRHVVGHELRQTHLDGTGREAAVKQILVRRSARHEIRSVEVFDESDHLGPAVAAELAEIEGLEPTIFLAADLNDAVLSNEGFFVEAASSPNSPSRKGSR